MDKEDVYKHNEILLSHKNVWNNVVCSNMNILRDYCTKLIMSDKEWQIPWYHSCVESKIWHKWTYLQNKNKPRHTEQSCGCQGGGAEGRMKWEFGVSGCKLVYRYTSILYIVYIYILYIYI